MKTNACHLLRLVLPLVFPVLPLTGQVVTDTATATLSNVTNSFPGNVTVGTNGSFTLLILSNNTLLTNSLNGVIGRNATAMSNEVRLISPTARWAMNGNLFVGSNGPASRLVVSNGGFVRNGIGTLGQNIPSSNNLAIVSGTGSIWSNSSALYLGSSGGGNRMLVSSGGVVRDTLAYLGLNASSSNNTATITGAGSVWSNAFELYHGFNSLGNQLIVSNSAMVLNSVGTIGTSITSSNNVALVTGTGSVWTNAYDFYLGFAGASNRLTVADGALLRNTFGTIGHLESSSNNVALITGAGTLWSNAGDLYIGNAGRQNQLIVSNGATVTAAISFIGFNVPAQNNSVIVADAGTRWLLSSNIYVGTNGGLNRLVITNGAYVENAYCYVGGTISSSNNEVIVTGAGSFWTNRQSLNLGVSGRGNRLVVSGGARLRSNLGSIGVNSSSSNNEAIFTGAGTFWDVPNSLTFGSQSSGNRLVLSNGAAMRTDGAYIGFSNICSNNAAVITGAGSAWTNTGPFYVGYFSPANLLLITNGGSFVSSRIVTMGDNALGPNNRIIIDGGTLLMTNDPLDVKRGTNVLNAGLMDLKQLLVTNTLGAFEFNGGQLKIRDTVINNSRVFTVGDGVKSATCQLMGGTNLFANNLAISTNATLRGNGSIIGVLTVQNGAVISPGLSTGTLVLSNTPVLQGTTLMEVSRNGATLTNDQLQVAAPINYGGALVVTNIGLADLVVSNRFKLFSATSYAGAFTTISLPTLNVGLSWTNKLLVDGSIEVVGVPIPVVDGIKLSGNNVIIAGAGGPPNGSYYMLAATNVTLALSNWTRLSTNQFDALGNFSFTNATSPAVPQRFYRLQLP